MHTVMVLKAVNRGLKKAQDEYNSRETVKDGLEPPFKYGIIVCAMRMFRRNFSDYFKNLINAHRHSPAKEIYGMASMELARAAIQARDEHGLPVVGFDLAGEEAGYPAGDHENAFAIAHKHFLKKTVHAGEAYGPESIFQAITDLYADRIGHGTYLLEPQMLTDPEIDDPQAYVGQLSQYIADRRITLEICLTSNLQTNPNMGSLEDHSFKRLRAARLSTTLCTDNRTVSNTTVTNEIMLAVKHLDLDLHDLKSIIVYGFKRSFMPGSYLDKRAYVRQVIDYCSLSKIISGSLSRSIPGGRRPMNRLFWVTLLLVICACQDESNFEPPQTDGTVVSPFLDAGTADPERLAKGTLPVVVMRCDLPDVPLTTTVPVGQVVSWVRSVPRVVNYFSCSGDCDDTHLSR